MNKDTLLFFQEKEKKQKKAHLRGLLYLKAGGLSTRIVKVAPRRGRTALLLKVSPPAAATVEYFI